MADEDVAGLDQTLTSSDHIDRGFSGVHPAYIGQLEGKKRLLCTSLVTLMGAYQAVRLCSPADALP